MHKYIALISMGLLIFSMSVELRAAAIKATPCSFGAFVQESDPAGLNVRKTASLSGKIVGTLPSVIESNELEGYQVKIELDILGSNNGWFQITNAHDNTSLSGKPPRPVFSGTGWVSGRKLTVKSQAKKAFAQPDIKSPVVFSLRDGSSFDNDEIVQAVQLISCQGQWVQVEVISEKMSSDMNKLLIVDPAAQAGLPMGRFRVWLNQICANQETSCDGIAVEN
jgi:hypothetical protein